MLDSPPSFSKEFTGWLFKYHCEFMNTNIMYFELIIFADAQMIPFLAIGASPWVFVTCLTAPRSFLVSGSQDIPDHPIHFLPTLLSSQSPGSFR